MFRSKCKEHDHSKFYQPLQMERSQKNTDCYFFYYSTCKKGDFCPFRHEPTALGCEIVCRYWQQGNCIDEHCNFRHMELKKNRKSIPCYWETQPGGCKKPHCSFMHKSEQSGASDAINPVKDRIRSIPGIKETKYGGSSTESDQGRGSSEASSFIGSPAVDPLIVKFEKESDSESVPSPVKPQPRVPYCKTYEEIRLEEIQAESAAYYSYEATEDQSEVGGGKMKTVRSSRKVSPYPKIVRDKSEESPKELDFQVLTLEEIRRRKMRKATLQQTQQIAEVRPLVTVDTVEELQKDLLKDAIKNLAELKAEGVFRGIKRTIDDCDTQDLSEDQPPKCRAIESSVSPTKVPPVRLRRCAKRFATGEWETRNIHKIVDDVTRMENLENRLPDPIERLAVKPSAPDEVDSSHTSRKSDVEVRLCDSSTDEDQSKIEKEDRKSIATGTTDDSASKAAHLMYENLLNINDDDYLSLDTTSADILKDIDALLTEKEGTV